MRQEKFPQLGRKERRTVGARIKIEKQAAILSQEARPNIVDEKFPIRGRPFNAIADPADPMKTNPVRGHEIERLMEIGQGSLPFDSTDHARNIENLSGRAEERFVVSVEAENVMTKTFADVKKVTGTASKIDNAQRRRTIEPKILRALDVDLDPISNVLESVDLG